MKKIITIVLAMVMALSLGTSAFAYETGWQYDGKGWWYLNSDGSYPAGCWQYDAGYWYHFDDAGYMQTGWLLDSGTWYYLNDSGAMETGWFWDGMNWYYLDPSTGAMYTGWLLDNEIWFYLDSTGAMTTGWKEIDGAWYYFDEYGRMYSNSYIDQKYFVDENGRWDGITISENSGAQQTGTTFTFHQKGWYVARLEVEVWDNDIQDYKWFYSESRAIGQTAHMTIDPKYEIQRVGYQIWFFGWDNDYMNLPWANTDYATTFTLSGSGDYPEFSW